MRTLEREPVIRGMPPEEEWQKAWKEPESDVDSPDTSAAVAPTGDAFSGNENRDWHREHLDEAIVAGTHIVLEAKDAIEADPSLDVDKLRAQLHSRVNDLHVPDAVREYYQERIDQSLERYKHVRENIGEMKQIGPRETIRKLFGDREVKRDPRIIKETPFALTFEVSQQDLAMLLSGVTTNASEKASGGYLSGTGVILTRAPSLNPMENSQAMQVSHENIHAFNAMVFESDNSKFNLKLKALEELIQSDAAPIEEVRGMINDFSNTLLETLKNEIITYFNQQETGLLRLIVKLGDSNRKMMGGSGKKFLTESSLHYYVKWANGVLDDLQKKTSRPEVRDLLERRKATIQDLVKKAIATYEELHLAASKTNSDNSLSDDDVHTRRGKLATAAALTPLHSFHQLKKAAPRLFDETNANTS